MNSFRTVTITDRQDGTSFPHRNFCGSDREAIALARLTWSNPAQWDLTVADADADASDDHPTYRPIRPMRPTQVSASSLTGRKGFPPRNPLSKPNFFNENENTQNRSQQNQTWHRQLHHRVPLRHDTQ